MFCGFSQENKKKIGGLCGKNGKRPGEGVLFGVICLSALRLLCQNV